MAPSKSKKDDETIAIEKLHESKFAERVSAFLNSFPEGKRNGLLANMVKHFRGDPGPKSTKALDKDYMEQDRYNTELLSKFVPEFRQITAGLSGTYRSFLVDNEIKKKYSESVPPSVPLKPHMRDISFSEYTEKYIKYYKANEYQLMEKLDKDFKPTSDEKEKLEQLLPKADKGKEKAVLEQEIEELKAEQEIAAKIKVEHKDFLSDMRKRMDIKTKQKNTEEIISEALVKESENMDKGSNSTNKRFVINILKDLHKHLIEEDEKTPTGIARKYGYIRDNESFAEPSIAGAVVDSNMDHPVGVPVSTKRIRSKEETALDRQISALAYRIEQFEEGKKDPAEIVKMKQKLNTLEAEFDSKYGAPEPSQMIPGVGSAAIAVDATPAAGAILSSAGENTTDQAELNTGQGMQTNDPDNDGTPAQASGGPTQVHQPPPVVPNAKQSAPPPPPNGGIANNPAYATIANRPVANTIGNSGTMRVDNQGNLVQNRSTLESIDRTTQELMNIDLNTAAGKKYLAQKLANINGINSAVAKQDNSYLPYHYGANQEAERRAVMERTAPMPQYQYSQSQMEYLKYLESQKRNFHRIQS